MLTSLLTWWRGRRATIVRRPLLIAGTLFAFLGIATPLSARAQSIGGIFELLFNGGVALVVGPMFAMVSIICFVVAWVVSLIAGMVVAFLGWMLQIVLALNMNIVNSTAVTTGFPVMLSIANLFFVFGIIVIAIATILHIESYGIKKALIALVMMAILVNFGLVIAAVILDFSDSFTVYFVQSISPLQEEEGASALVLASPVGFLAGTHLNEFASTITMAFQPQANFFFGGIAKSVGGAAAAGDLDKIIGALNLGAQSTQNLIAPIAGLLMSVISLIIIIIILGSLVVMLLYRYVKLALLLVLLPLQWAGYALPGTKKYFSKWWDDFIKLAFFPPILVFFLWLALKVAEAMSESRGEFAAIADSSELRSGLERSVSPFFAGNMEQVIRMFILGSIMMGGLAAASKFGVKFAETAIKGIEGAKHFGVKHASRYGRRGAAYGADKLKLKKGFESLAARPADFSWRGAKGQTGFLGNVLNKGLSMFGAAGLDGLKGLKGSIKQAEKDLAGESELERRKKMRGGSGSLEDTIARLANAVEKGKIHLIGKINGQDPAEWIEEHLDTLRRFGQGGLINKINDDTLLNEKIRQATMATKVSGGADGDFFDPVQFRQAFEDGITYVNTDQLRNILMTHGGYGERVKRDEVPFDWNKNQMMQTQMTAMGATLKSLSGEELSKLLGLMGNNTNLVNQYRDFITVEAKKWATANGVSGPSKDIIDQFVDSDAVSIDMRQAIKASKNSRSARSIGVDALSQHLDKRTTDGISDEMIGGWNTSSLP